MSINRRARHDVAGTTLANSALSSLSLEHNDPAVEGTPSRQRSTLAAVLHALPALSMILLVLWFFIAAFAWMLSAFFGGSAWLLGGTLALLSIPAAWVSWRVSLLAVAAER